MSIFFGVGK